MSPSMVASHLPPPVRMTTSLLAICFIWKGHDRLTGGFSSTSSPARGLAFKFAKTPSFTWLLFKARALEDAGVYVGLLEEFGAAIAAEGNDVVASTGVEASRSAMMSLRRSRALLSSSSSSDGASNALSRSRSSSLRRRLSLDGRREDG